MFKILLTELRKTFRPTERRALIFKAYYDLSKRINRNIKVHGEKVTKIEFLLDSEVRECYFVAIRLYLFRNKNVHSITYYSKQGIRTDRLSKAAKIKVYIINDYSWSGENL